MKQNKPTEKDIMTIDYRDNYKPGTAFWKNEVKKNLQEIKERKEKGTQFRKWHQNNKNNDVVEYWELVKRTVDPKKLDENISSRFWK